MYVALGRVVHPDNLKIWTRHNARKVVNVVYRDVYAIGGC